MKTSRLGTTWRNGFSTFMGSLAKTLTNRLLSSGAEGPNNILALAFGVFIVALVVFGSMIIMATLDANM